MFVRQVTKEELERMHASSNHTVVEKENFANIPKKVSGDTRIFAHFDNDKIIECFSLQKNGNTYFVPEPDPILIYFNNAYFCYKAIKEQEKELFKKLEVSNLNEGVAGQLYTHFGNCMGFVTALFTSMETFINSQIPQSYSYKIEQNNRTEIYNYDQIQRYVSFDDKWKKIIPEITKKDFAVNFPLKHQHLVNLKEFRNMIIHTKAINEGSTPYNYLFKKAFTFKYEDALFTVRDYINFYKEDYIVECDCDKDF